MVMLECRLDNIIFRLGFARTRKEARQIVDHKHVSVNGKLVNIPSYQVKLAMLLKSEKNSKLHRDIKTSLRWLAAEWFLNGLKQIRKPER